MANRILHLRKHHPLITLWIEFRLAPPFSLPLLTPCIEFDPDRLVRSRPPSDKGNEGGSNKRRWLLFSSWHAGEDSDEHGDDHPPGEASASSPSTLKPKPAGEPGKPGSGGFSLENALINVHKWVKKDYNALYVCSKFSNTFHPFDMATGTSKGRGKQNVGYDTKLQIPGQGEGPGYLQQGAFLMLIFPLLAFWLRYRRRWPELATYESCWPVVSIVKLALKYTSEASKWKDKEPVTGSARV